MNNNISAFFKTYPLILREEDGRKVEAFTATELNEMLAGWQPRQPTREHFIHHGRKLLRVASNMKVLETGVEWSCYRAYCHRCN